MPLGIKKIGITGSNGFIGTHLSNYLNLFHDKYTLVPFSRDYFDDEIGLDNFVSSCDVIVHLAALNRHNDPEVLYSKNIGLVNLLLKSIDRTKSKPHVIFSSSTQENIDNLYGKSKKEGREKFSQWASMSGSIFTGIIIPNTFGPFGDPYYNSVVATFCHQLTHDQTPKIEVDGELKLIYIYDLVQEIVLAIDNGIHNDTYLVKHHHTIRVSKLLAQLMSFKNIYDSAGQIPLLESSFDFQLFNTYRCYLDLSNYFPRKYHQHHDNRGAFTELIRTDIKGQFSFSSTNPGVTRGNHYHLRKIERFSVIKGKACIKLRRIGTDKVFEFYLDGDAPAYVDMPIWYTHSITNIGEELLYTCFWINESYNPDDPDTYLEIV